MHRRMIIPLAAVAILAACGGGDEPAAVEAPAATDAPAATQAPAADGGATAVPAALDFSAPLVGGGDIEAAALAGRPVLLWFWAPW